MNYYLSRDRDGICFWRDKPQFINSVYYKRKERNFVYGFCRKDFEEITGIHLKPGELRKIKSIKIKLEE